MREKKKKQHRREVYARTARRSTAQSYIHVACSRYTRWVFTARQTHGSIKMNALKNVCTQQLVEAKHNENNNNHNNKMKRRKEKKKKKKQRQKEREKKQ